MTIEKAIKSGAAKVVLVEGKAFIEKGGRYLPLTKKQYSQLKKRQ